ncbi:hypothetical protein SFRURICE_000796 [Spodoptera frugiperda]|nr:hypothetical protein SFRURICE_000796 [Spodoptera frugiperda]
MRRNTKAVTTNVWVGGGAMREEDLEVALKVVIVGDGGVGKSSMIQRYCRGTFTRDYKKTIGVDFLERQIEIDGEEVRLMLWDTAGQEEFDAITKAYYRGAHACVLAFSTTDRDSFLSLHSWKLKMHGYHAFIFTFLYLLCGVNSINYGNREIFCIRYYATGENFDLKELPAQMHGVYYWPPRQRQRDSCAIINFREVSDDEETSEDCSNPYDLDETVIKATYTNSTGKTVSLLYYGDTEVKQMYRSCDKPIAKYIFKKVNANYILGINCSAGGRGILFSRFLPSTPEVQSIVENECGEIPTIIVQNKIDLMDQCVVGPDEAELVARALGCRLMRASVKEDVNVGAVFRALAARCLSDMRRDDADTMPPCQQPVIGTFTNHNSNGTILLRPTKHRPGGKKKNVLRNACRLL